MSQSLGVVAEISEIEAIMVAMAGPRGRHVNRHRVSEIALMKAAGMNWREISHELGVSAAIASKTFKEWRGLHGSGRTRKRLSGFVARNAGRSVLTGQRREACAFLRKLADRLDPEMGLSDEYTEGLLRAVQRVMLEGKPWI